MIHDDIVELMNYDDDMQHGYFKPQFVEQYSTEHERLFMTRKIHPATLKYAAMMYSLAPKKCEKCDKDLSIQAAYSSKIIRTLFSWEQSARQLADVVFAG